MPLPRFVELVRVSSSGQAERDSPADQRAALDGLRRARPGTLVERVELGAAGLSGALPLAKRPDLIRLKQLASAGGFEELRVRHFDRLIRVDDPDEQEAVFSILRRAGAVLVETDGAVTDPRSLPGRIVAIVKAEGAAEERRKIVERTVAARKRLSAQGRPMTTLPFARTYNFETGTWGVDARKMEVYRRIFRETIAGVSLHQLAAKLNREGISAPKGGLWEASSLRRMLRNGSAVGRMTSYGHPVACPPVVDEMTQRRALAAMARGRTRSGPPARHEALLRKIATCGVCGSTMHVHLGNTRSNPILYYRCAGAKPRTCSARTYHPVVEVDAAIVEALEQAARHPRRLARAAATTPETNTAEDDAKAARRDLERLDRREENLIRMRSQGEVRDEMFRRQSLEIARLSAEAASRLAAAESVLDTAQSAQDRARDVISAVEGLRARTRRATRHDWRRLLEMLFPRGPGTWLRIHPDGRIETNPPLGEP